MNTDTLDTTITAAVLIGVAALLIGWLVYALLQSSKPGPSLHCCRCEACGPTRAHTPGSFMIQLMLLLCAVVPGIIYALWRSSSSKWVCPVCGSDDLIPLHSPRALRLSRENRSDATPVPRSAFRDLNS